MTLNRFGVLLLCVAGGLLTWQAVPKIPRWDQQATPNPPPHLSITVTDPGDKAAIKLMAIYSGQLGQELDAFADRVAANPTSQEWGGVGPAAEAWRQISEEVLLSSQQGLQQKIMQMQDDQVGWQAGADWLESAAEGFRQSSEQLRQLAGE